MRLSRFWPRRHLLFAALAGAVARLLRPSSARADLFGGDDVILSGILAQAIAEVSTLGSMLTSIMSQLELVRTELSALDPHSFQSLYDLVDDLSLGYDALTSGIQSVGYTLASVNARFQKEFPSNLSKVPFAQFDGLYGQWQNEILAASQVAERAQTTLSRLASDAASAHAVLAHSAAAAGEVGQLQSVVQMLGLMQSQNGTLIQTLATTGRVLASTAASSASERQLSREKKKRNLANYTSRGSPVPPMRMP
jgi:conjugal transfer/entry exclusion protein